MNHRNNISQSFYHGKKKVGFRKMLLVTLGIINYKHNRVHLLSVWCILYNLAMIKQIKPHFLHSNERTYHKL